MRLRTPADFGALVRDRRSKLGLSQAQLARSAGVDRVWLIEFEKGKPRAPLALVLRTLDAVGIALLSDEGARKAKKAKGLATSVDIDQLLENLRRKKT